MISVAGVIESPEASRTLGLGFIWTVLFRVLLCPQVLVHLLARYLAAAPREACFLFMSREGKEPLLFSIRSENRPGPAACGTLLRSCVAQARAHGWSWFSSQTNLKTGHGSAWCGPVILVTWGG